MATYTGDYALETLAPLFSDAGNVFGVIGTYDLATSMGAGDVIEIVRVPGGCKALCCLLDRGGTGVTVDIGTSDDADVLGNGVSSDGVVLDGLFETIGDTGEETTIQVTLGGAPTAAGTLTLAVLYINTNIKD